jgi:Flp pilus assembly protein TadG
MSLLRAPSANGRRQGGVFVWLLMSVTVIIGILGIGLDGGRMMEERRHVQAAADAAALAGGAGMYRSYVNYGGNDANEYASNAALASAAANGYANDGINSTVTVNVPPKTGAFSGNNGYVEVIVQSNLSSSFGAVFTGQRLAARARAVARGKPRNLGVVVLKPSGSGTFGNSSTATFTALNTSIYVNSSDPSAFTNSSSGLTIARSFQIVGGYTNPGGGLIWGSITTGAPPFLDPLASLPAPSTSGIVQSAAPLVINTPIAQTLNPGVYKGGIQIQGGSIVTLSPGLYILDGGGLYVGNASTLVASQAMIYNTSITLPAGPISIGSGTSGSVSWLPPTSGTYQGISIFQDRSLTQPIAIKGFGTASLFGTIYAANAPVSLSSVASAGLTDTLGGAFVCSTLQVSGGGSISVNLGGYYPRVPQINLVE